MLSSDVFTNVTQYGLWVILDPSRREVKQIHRARISPEADRFDIYTDSSKTTLWRTVWHSEYGRTWFKTRKDALRYLNSLT
jgi:hypothetical protein